MDFIRNKVAKINRGFKRNKDNRNENDSIDDSVQVPVVTIAGGKVEEAVHYMSDPGYIDLSFLRFYSSSTYRSQYYNSGNTNNYKGDGAGSDDAMKHINDGVESFLDVAVFEVPEHCTSRNCDLSRFGVGSLSHFKSSNYLTLCKNGRLVLDHNNFKGFHTQLMIPSEGPMPTHIKNAKFSVPEKRFYEVILANCNGKGQRVHVSGQVVFDFEYGIYQLTGKSMVILMSVAFFVFVCLSTLAIRISCGTRSDFESRRLGRHVRVPTEDNDAIEEDNFDGDLSERIDSESAESGSTSIA